MTMSDTLNFDTHDSKLKKKIKVYKARQDSNVKAQCDQFCYVWFEYRKFKPPRVAPKVNTTSKARLDFDNMQYLCCKVSFFTIICGMSNFLLYLIHVSTFVSNNFNFYIFVLFAFILISFSIRFNFVKFYHSHFSFQFISSIFGDMEILSCSHNISQETQSHKKAELIINNFIESYDYSFSNVVDQLASQVLVLPKIALCY